MVITSLREYFMGNISIKNLWFHLRNVMKIPKFSLLGRRKLEDTLGLRLSWGWRRLNKLERFLYLSPSSKCQKLIFSYYRVWKKHQGFSHILLCFLWRNYSKRSKSWSANLAWIIFSNFFLVLLERSNVGKLLWWRVRPAAVLSTIHQDAGNKKTNFLLWSRQIRKQNNRLRTRPCLDQKTENKLKKNNRKS